RWCSTVWVAKPRDVRLSSRSRRKSDRVDARCLADLASVRPNLLHPIEHVSAHEQTSRPVLRCRDALVRSRSRLILHARGLVKAMGGRLPSCSAEALARKAMASVPGPLV